VRGSFTGASTDRAGAFREAEDGTLFLDEIGDMPLTMQAKILRAIEERTVTPIGGKACDFNARLVSATHRDLPTMVRAGTFREDLYYRLSVIPLELPPLRQRREDILPLTEAFLSEATRECILSKEAEKTLLAHDWPGNVRELRNVIESRAC
jgi:DNA-binding NtrC family response regulator